MNLLAMDTSGLVVTVALYADGQLAGEYTLHHKKTHSQTLLPLIDALLKQTEVEPEALSAIAVAAGPGSFTGLRIGAATAKGLAMALHKPLIAVPTLDALAYQCFGTTRVICPMMDARRNQVYTGCYKNDTEFLVLSEGEACAVETVIARVNAAGEPVLYLGDGVPVYRALLEEQTAVPYLFAPAFGAWQRAGALAALAAEYYEEERFVDCNTFAPLYLRKPQAEREREERLAEREREA